MKPREKTKVTEVIPDGEFDKYVQTDISGPIVAALKNFDSPTKVEVKEDEDKKRDIGQIPDYQYDDKKDGPYAKGSIYGFSYKGKDDFIQRTGTGLLDHE